MKIKIMTAVFIALFFFASCAKSDETKIPPTEAQKADTGAEIPQETKEQRILSEAPVQDFGGAGYRILGRLAVTANRHWDAKDLYAEEENGDVINDAVYTRNKTIEEKFNVKITRVEAEPPASLARKAVNAGSDEYDVVYDAIVNTVSMASAGLGVNLKEVPYIDLEKPWYDQNANRQLSLGGKLYMTFSDFTILDKDATWVYLFNKQLLADLGLSDPYQSVREGKWTIDTLYAMCKDAARDLDGDGVMGNWDQYGYMGEGFNMYAGIIASDVVWFPKNENDLPTYNGVSERAFSAFEKLIQVLGNKEISLRSEDVKGVSGDIWLQVMDPGFMEGRILFHNAGMNRVTLFRSMEIDFGILPSPKFDEAQENYYNTLTHGSATPLFIPATIDGENLTRVGILTDALAAESSYTLIPAYYDTQLKTKLARDDDSGEMMDIIFENRRFDLGLIYDIGGIPGIFSSAMTQNNLNIASSLEKAEARIQKDLDKLAAQG